MSDWADKMADQIDELTFDGLRAWQLEKIAEMFRATRIEALEEAARLAQEEAESALYDESDGSSVYACNNVAAAIRALKDKQP